MQTQSSTRQRQTSEESSPRGAAMGMHVMPMRMPEFAWQVHGSASDSRIAYPSRGWAGGAGCGGLLVTLLVLVPAVEDGERSILLGGQTEPFALANLVHVRQERVGCVMVFAGIDRIMQLPDILNSGC